MILDLLGPNLNDLMILCGGKFSLGTAINLVTQIVINILLRFKELKCCMRVDSSIEI